tara:strand:- start:1639 stop:2259 length:621 start_codon:yes stop_codon:yes gene_type:complete
MNYKNGFWFFDRVLTSKFCDDIIKHGNNQKEQVALTGNLKPEDLTEENLLNLKKKRDSNLVWLDDQWIYNEILSFVKTANENAKWNFEWDWAESCQFTKYKLNQYYDWHQDSWPEAYLESRGVNFVGKIRKLSVTINLTEGTEYEGGDLQFDFSSPENKENIITVGQARSKGSIIVFPSYQWHRVTPVTKGTRYSLVIWCCGKPFK